MLPVTWVCDPRKGFNPLCLFSLLCTLTPTGFFLPSPFRATFGQLPLMLTTLMLPLCLLLGDPVATNCPENSWDQTVTFINLSKVRAQKITQRLLYDLKNLWACHRLPQCRKRLHHPPAPRHLVTPQIEFRAKWTSKDALSPSPTYLGWLTCILFAGRNPHIQKQYELHGSDGTIAMVSSPLSLKPSFLDGPTLWWCHIYGCDCETPPLIFKKEIPY